MDISFSPNNSYIPHCATVIASIIENNPSTDFSFHIICPDISLSNKKSLEDWIKVKPKCKIFFYSIDQSFFDGFPTNNVFPNYATYFRLFSAEVLPIDKVLHFDCDLIVCHSILDLWNIDISDYALAAVRDTKNDDISIYNRLDYDKEYGYINAGVMLVNLNKWRKSKIPEKSKELINNKHLRLDFYDQDIINKVFHGQIKFIDFKFNVQEPFFYTENWMCIDKKYYPAIIEACRIPVILHYGVPYKPWHTENINPYKNLYAEYRALTPWPQFKLIPRKKRTLRSILVKSVKTLLTTVHLYKPKVQKVLRDRVDVIQEY